MQSTDLGNRHNLAGAHWLDRSFAGRVLFQTQVRAASMSSSIINGDAVPQQHFSPIYSHL